MRWPRRPFSGLTPSETEAKAYADVLEPWEIRAKAVDAFKALSGWGRRDSVQAIKATEPRATPEDWAEAAWELRAGVR